MASNFNANANSNNMNNADQAALLQQQRQIQEIIKAFNIADPAHPGNQQSKKKYWVKILLTDFQLSELQQLAQMLGTQPYIDPTTGQPMVDPATGKQVHAIEDTTVASLMKSSALGTYLKYKIEEYQKNAQAQMQTQQAQPQF